MLFVLQTFLSKRKQSIRCIQRFLTIEMCTIQQFMVAECGLHVLITAHPSVEILPLKSALIFLKHTAKIILFLLQITHLQHSSGFR